MERYKKLILASVFFSLSATLLLLYFTISEETIESLKAVQIKFLLLALSMHIFSLLIWTFRIKFLARALNFQLEFRRSLEIVLLSVFTAAITPSQAGGEPVRIAMLTRCGMNPGDSSAVVLGERVMDGIFLALLALIGLFILQSYLENHQYLRIVAIVSLFLILAGIFILFLSLLHPERTIEMMRRLAAKIVKRVRWLEKRERIVERFIEEIQNFQIAMRTFGKRRGAEVYCALLLTALYWTNEFLIPSVVLLGLQEPPNFLFCYFIQAVLTVILMMPLTPGSSGIAELGAATFYSVIVPPYKLGIFVVAWRFTVYHVNLITGFLMSLKVLRTIGRKRRESEREGNG